MGLDACLNEIKAHDEDFQDVWEKSVARSPAGEFHHHIRNLLSAGLVYKRQF